MKSDKKQGLFMKELISFDYAQLPFRLRLVTTKIEDYLYGYRTAEAVEDPYK